MHYLQDKIKNQFNLVLTQNLQIGSGQQKKKKEELVPKMKRTKELPSISNMLRSDNKIHKFKFISLSRTLVPKNQTSPDYALSGKKERNVPKF